MMDKLRSLSRRMWVRMTLVAIAGLAVTLVLVVGAVYQLTIVNEHSDLDALLSREGDAVARQMTAEVSALAGGPDGIDTNGLETIASRSLALHPGSSLHMAVVRIGDAVLTSARGPERIESLRDANELPNVTPGVLESRKGIRARSQEITFQDLTVTVETIGDDQAIVDDARKIAERVLFAALIGGIIGTIGLAVAVRASTKQLDEVSDTVRRTRLDDLSARVSNTQGAGEVAVLSRDVNAMLDELTQARSTRDELIASVSHELRTPLAAARGHAELLKEGRSHDQSLTVTRIDRELHRITRLVDDLLALSRAGDPGWLSMNLVSVGFILEELSGRMSTYSKAGLSVLPGPDVMIEADMDRLLQALSNLVLNAIVHTPPETTVEVEARVDESAIEFSITDNGPGIPAHVLDNFGEAFVRGSTTGTGLGLAVSRAVATAHRGRLEVHSNAAGTTVTLSLPIESTPS